MHLTTSEIFTETIATSIEINDSLEDVFRRLDPNKSLNNYISLCEIRNTL